MMTKRPGPEITASSERLGSGPEFARGIVAALKSERVRSLVYVPDAVLAPILDLAAADPAFELTGVTREEEGVAVIAGQYIGGLRSALLLQSSGLGNSLNVLGSLVIPFGIPCVLIVSLRGEVGDRNVAQVPFGRAVPGILKEMGIQHRWITSGAGAESAMQDVVRSAFRWGMPVAAILTREASDGIEE